MEAKQAGQAGKGFEVRLTPTQVLLRVEPPRQGAKANLTEIQQALRDQGVSYRHNLLFDIYRRAAGEFEPLARRESEEYTVQVDVSPDGLQATATAIPPYRGEDRLDAARVRRALGEAKVQLGILDDAVERMVRERIDDKPVLVARGKPAVHGRDGWVEYIEPEHPAGPPGDEIRVDYKELNLIRNVAEGELIARVHPPTEGEDGFTVLGRELGHRKGRPALVKLGRNVTRDDRGEIRAAGNGYVTTLGDRLAVDNVYEVKNVDAASGNIHFNGVVMVRGSVEDGFVVEAERGIEVAGPVGKATLRCAGDIMLRGGAMGATLEAGKNVSAKFLSECTVQAGDTVTAEDYVLHSTVHAGRTVRVNKAPSGFITGGLARAGELVSAPNLGSTVGEEKTVVEVGMRPNLRQQFDHLRGELERNRLTFDKLRKNLLVLQRQRERQPLDAERQAGLARMVQAARQVRDQLWEQAEGFRALEDEMKEHEAGTGLVLASETTHPGVMVQIRRQRRRITTPIIGSAFKLMRGELRVQDHNEAYRHYKLQRAGQPPA